MIKFLVISALVGVAFADSTPISSELVEPGNRILDGEDASIKEVPYQVSILVQNKHNCGGSIIAKNWVLTAAHCAIYPIDDYRVRAGSSISGSGGTIHRVSHIIIHKKYYVASGGYPANDIALFQIEPAFKMDSTRRIIKLFKSGEEAKVGSYSVITGWGQISMTSSVGSRVLQRVRVPIISKAECKKAYADLTKLRDGGICAGYPEGGKDSCQGDSGGPLVINGRLAGVVSWGKGCGIAGRPTVYMEVAYYRDWIDDAMNASMDDAMDASMDDTMEE